MIIVISTYNVHKTYTCHLEVYASVQKAETWFTRQWVWFVKTQGSV